MQVLGGSKVDGIWDRRGFCGGGTHASRLASTSEGAWGVPRTNVVRVRFYNLLTPSNFDLCAIIRLTDGEVKQTEGVSGQNRFARCEVIEPDPSIANPDHA
jgi:hypothetical protein